MKHRRLARPRAQQHIKRSRLAGVTLVELLVSLVLMSLITLATVSLYSVNSQSYKTVDASQSLDDNARFALDVLGQAFRNAGYREVVVLGDVTTPANNSASTLFDVCAAAASTEPCPLLGFDNSRINTIAAVDDFGGAARGGVNLSDSLAIRFSGSGTGNDGDRSIVACNGRTTPAPTATNLADIGLSLFWLREVQGEPELTCTSQGFNAAGTWARNTEGIIRGVEAFQVMYGLDVTSPPDEIPDRWVSASGVGANWRNVRAIRVGMVLRGDPGSAQLSQAQTLYPLGKDFIGTSTEAGLIFTSPADGRLRRTYSSTFLIRNAL